MLDRPGQDAVAKLGHLHPIANDDRILADEIDAADVTVQVDADTGPVEARRHLFDVRRLPRAVITGDDDTPVFGKARENG